MVPKLTKIEEKLNYNCPLWFYQKSLTDPPEGGPHKIHGKDKVGHTT